MGTNSLNLYYDGLHPLYALHLCVSPYIYCFFPFRRRMLTRFFKWLKARISRGRRPIYGKSFGSTLFLFSVLMSM